MSMTLSYIVWKPVLADVASRMGLCLELTPIEAVLEWIPGLCRHWQSHILGCAHEARSYASQMDNSASHKWMPHKEGNGIVSRKGHRRAPECPNEPLTSFWIPKPFFLSHYRVTIPNLPPQGTQKKKIQSYLRHYVTWGTIIFTTATVL